MYTATKYCKFIFVEMVTMMHSTYSSLKCVYMVYAHYTIGMNVLNTHFMVHLACSMVVISAHSY